MEVETGLSCHWVMRAHSMLTVSKMSLSAGCKYWSIVVYPKAIKVRLGGGNTSFKIYNAFN